MTDDYDLWIISEAFEINRSRIARAMPATYIRRGRPTPDEVPDGWSPVLEDETVARTRWESCERDLRIEPRADGVPCALVAYLMPAGMAAYETTRQVGAER